MSRVRKTQNFKDTSCPVSGSGDDASDDVVDTGPSGFPCGPKDERCNDPEFALANPELCSTRTTRLELRPGGAILLAGNTLQYATFVVFNDGSGAEYPVEIDLDYSSSNTAIATINASGGLATGVSAGVVTITVTWHGMVSHAQLTVIASCGSSEVAIVIDDSKSMGSPFGSGYSTRLAFAKAVANQFISDTDTAQASLDIVAFNLVQTTFGPSTDSTALLNYVSLVPQTQAFTSLGNAIHAAATKLAASSATQKIILLISDGEERAAGDPTEANPITEATSFRDSGGLLACVGVRASGDGFSLLSQLATAGYFVNGTPANAVEIIELVSGLRGYFCGTCGSGPYPDCIAAPPDTQLPDEPPLPDIEVTGGTGHTYTKSATFTACCPSGQLGICLTDCVEDQDYSCVTRTAEYTSTTSDADAQTHANALARSLAFADLHCCKKGPINIVDFAPADPFPACYKIAGAATTTTSVVLKLHGFTHSWVADVAMVLVSPTGVAVEVMTGVMIPDNVHPVGVSNLELVIQDGASSMPCSAATTLTSGTYAPTVCNLSSNNLIPGGPFATTMSAFNGADPNGVWSLYVQDRAAQNYGVIQSWEVIVNSTANDSCTVSLPGPSPHTLKLTSSGSVVAAYAADCAGFGLDATTTFHWAVSFPNWFAQNSLSNIVAAIEFVNTGVECFFELRFYAGVHTGPFADTAWFWVGRLYGSSGTISPVGRYYRVNATSYGATACNTTLAYVDVTTI